MSSAKKAAPAVKKGKSSSFNTFLSDIRKKRIIEILAAFIAGGWLVYEIVERVLVMHYRFPEKLLDVTIVSFLGALICTLLWRWFSGRKAPRVFKLELVLIPLVLLITVLLDVNLLLHLKGPESETIPASNWKNSIAVLPFDNISSEEGQDYFCEGLTDELITRLSNLKELKVIAKKSVYSFKGQEIDIREIGKKLNVATVLEGGVRKAGNKLRITAQLINVSDGSHLWADSYDKDLTDIFAIQDEIALSVANKLKLTLLGDEKAKLGKRPTENLESYNAYLQGRFLLERGGRYFEKAKEYFSQAINLDPQYALGYAGLADVYTYMGEGGANPNDVIPRARGAALEALKIDDELAEGHLAMARIKFYYEWDWPGAEAEFLRAIEINPNYARAYSEYSINLYVLKRFDEALEKAKKGEELDPFSSQRILAVGDVLKHMRRYEEAWQVHESALEKDPNNDITHWGLFDLSVLRGRDEDILREMQKLMEMGGFPSWNANAQEMGIFKAICQEKGWRGGLEWNLTRMMQRAEKEHVSPFIIAQCQAILGNKDAALQWLEKAYRERDMLMPYLNTEPTFDSIRNEPRFIEIINNIHGLKGAYPQRGSVTRPGWHGIQLLDSKCPAVALRLMHPETNAMRTSTDHQMYPKAGRCRSTAWAGSP